MIGAGALPRIVVFLSWSLSRRGSAPGVPHVTTPGGRRPAALELRRGRASLAGMSQAADIPKLVSELADLSKTYLVENTVEPMRRMGRFAGLSLLGGILMAAGWILLSVAGLRLLSAVLPDTELWSVLAYVLAALAALATALLIIAGASRSRARP